MGDMQNILQIENLLDLVEYTMKDSSEKELLIWDYVSAMHITMNNSSLEISIYYN